MSINMPNLQLPNGQRSFSGLNPISQLPTSQEQFYFVLEHAIELIIHEYSEHSFHLAEQICNQLFAFDIEVYNIYVDVDCLSFTIERRPTILCKAETLDVLQNIVNPEIKNHDQIRIFTACNQPTTSLNVKNIK